MLRPYRIDEHRFTRVFLHEGDMFVGGRMEHHIGPVAFEYHPYPRLQPHIAYDRDERQVRETLLQLEPDVVHGCLRGIEQNEAPHSERSELPTQFAPYAARSAGNQYGSVAETGCHLLLFHVYFVAAEQVLYLDFPNTGHELVAAHLVYGRSYQHPDMMHFAVTYEPLLFGTYALVVGEKDSLDIVTGNNVDEILFVVEIIDGQVGQTVGFVGFPVIVESGYLVLFAVAHPGLERNAPVVHAVNQQPAVALRDFGNDDIVSQHHAHTHTYQHHRGHQHVQQAPYQELPVGQHHAEHHDSHQEQFHGGGGDQTPQLPERGVADDVAVYSEQIERETAGRNRQQRYLQHGGHPHCTGHEMSCQNTGKERTEYRCDRIQYQHNPLVQVMHPDYPFPKLAYHTFRHTFLFQKSGILRELHKATINNRTFPHTSRERPAYRSVPGNPGRTPPASGRLREAKIHNISFL